MLCCCFLLWAEAALPVWSAVTQSARRSSGHQDGLLRGGPWMPLPVRGAAERICHGSTAQGWAAGWRRGNLCLHISHIHIVQHWAAACSRRPPLSPQQNLHRPEDLLQKVSVFSVFHVHMSTQTMFSSSNESSTFCCSTGSEACVSRWEVVSERYIWKQDVMTLVLNNRISTVKISFPLWFTRLTSTQRLNNVSSGPDRQFINLEFWMKRW